MTARQKDIETITQDVLAGRAGRKPPSSVGDLHMLVAEIIAQQATQPGDAMPVSSGGLSEPDTARFHAFIERLKNEGVLNTHWRRGDTQDAAIEITERGRAFLLGGGADSKERREGGKTQPRGTTVSGTRTRERLLETILNRQGSGSAYISDVALAEDLGLNVDEVQGHLHVLEEKGRIQLAASFEGCSAFLSPSQQTWVREKLRRRPQNVAPGNPKSDPRKVFVIHGRNDAARSALFTFLRAIGLHPLEWSEIVKETGKAAPYIGEVLEKGFSIAQAVVVLMTPDDEARLREQYRGPAEPTHETELTPQPRPNVLLEGGMALGLFPDRTVIVEIGTLRPVSDIGGRHVIRMTDAADRRHELAQRLQTAGCEVNTAGTDWYKAGTFTGCV